MARRVLVATLGGSWAVVPEAVAMLDPERVPLFGSGGSGTDAHGRRHPLPAVDEVWAVGTAASAGRSGTRLAAWAKAVGIPVRLWWPEGMDDIASDDDARRMADLIHRIVWHAAAGRPPPVLSLAGGRKTMSADLQRAGQLYGHGGLLHVIETLDGEGRETLGRLAGDPLSLTRPLPEALAARIQPVVLSAGQPPADAVEAERSRLEQAAGGLPPAGAVRIDRTPLLDLADEVQREADSLRASFGLRLDADGRQGSFRALHALPLRALRWLRETRIGAGTQGEAQALEWLRALPKAELHCHLGGVLDAAGMVEVASEEAARVAEARRADPEFDATLSRLEVAVRGDDLDGVRAVLGADRDPAGWAKALRGRWRRVPEPLGVCGVLLAFAGHEALLDELVFGGLRDERRFVRIGIEAYERLGDLQGSGLLQSPATLRAVMEKVARRCREEGIRYLELRCSPLNCTRGGLVEDEVVGLLVEGAERMAPQTDARLIFTASRHGGMGRVEALVDLTRRLLEKGGRFARRFAGIDLAGAEHAAEAARFREAFRPLHERVVRVTIHAGEGEPVRNIWQAVYELSADRVGHGLTLLQDRSLLERFRERRIALEMCPSSNFQIVGFDDPAIGVAAGRTYPLAEYLRAGLRVTVNTDDPGMSRTSLPREYLKAARMTRGGLSWWQILQLVRNGFRAAFCPADVQARHLREAEEAVVGWVLERAS